MVKRILHPNSNQYKPTGINIPLEAEILAALGFAGNGYFIRPAVINGQLCARVIVPASAATATGG